MSTIQPPDGIILGFPFDHLMDRDCPLESLWPKSPGYEKRGYKKGVPGIKVYSESNSPSTGNIVICGEPGTGKSTLALQFAVKCAMYRGNNSIAAYIPLESTVEDVQAKARSFGWDKYLYPLQTTKPCDDTASLDTVRKSLEECLQKPLKVCKNTGCVILPSLSPRHVRPAGAADLFWHRYQQLERLLTAGQALEDEKKKRKKEHSQSPAGTELEGIRWIFPIVVLDSLNMFGFDSLTRDQGYMLFRLFHRFKRIGIFVVETSTAPPFDSTMADVVIRLSATKDQDYFVRHLEIEKSRFFNQVYGLHPFKTEKLKYKQGSGPRVPLQVPTVPEADLQDNDTKSKTCGIVAYPSLHSLVQRTEWNKPKIGRVADATSQKAVSRINFGIKAFDGILQKNLNRGDVITIVGPPATFKATFALNFIARGLADGESAMIIRLSENRLLQPKLDRRLGSNPRLEEKNRPRLSEELCAKFAPLSKDTLPFFDWDWMECASNCKRIRMSALDQQAENKVLGYDHAWENLAPASKVLITAWRLTDEGIENLVKQHFHKKPGRTTRKQEWQTRLTNMRLFELDLRGGAIMPEEFVHILREILIRRPEGPNAIRRVFFGDISQIGVSYPFLRQSISAGDLFLPTFVHIMRNHGIDLVMTGTTSNLPLANEAVNRAWSLADATLSCDLCDVFGDRHVVVRGPGQMSAGTTEARSEGEIVPAVVQLVGAHAFKVDDKYLEGLVGFDNPPIHRPGATIHVFEENRAVHGTYNREIEAMLSAALLARKDFGASARRNIISNDRADMSPKVHVQPFTSSYSGAIHDSLNVLHEQAPLEETVLYTVDEFVYTADEFGKKLYSRFYDYGKPLAKELPPPAIRSKWRFVSSACFWPYCSNVLLLAYRRNWLTTLNPKSWKEVLTKARGTTHEQLKAPSGLGIQRLFWYDRTASETLSCALLDALVCESEQRDKLRAAEEKLRAAEEKLRAAEEKLRVAEGKPRAVEEELRAVEELCNDVKRASLEKDEAMNELNAVWSELLEQTELTDPQKENVEALCGLLHEMYAPDKYHSDEANRDAKAILDAEKQEMPTNAGIYLCWYSQLRDLIKREPRLAQELAVCALPGGGFTGDWFIGVVKGSVSLALGREIIRMLCSQEEDYKRFTHGVGLPVSESFYKRNKAEFYAWSHAVDISLINIKGIYDDAHSRAEIRDYREFHTALSVIARQLAPPDLSRKPSEDEKNKAREDAILIVKRVFAQIQALKRPI